MAGIQHNAGQIAARFAARARAVPRELSLAAEGNAALVTAEAKRIMEERIYAIPEKPGQPARTGRLLAGEKAVARGLGVQFEDEEAPYWEHRHNLGLPGHRQPVPPTQSVQWRPEAIRNTRPATLAGWRDGVLRALKGG